MRRPAFLEGVEPQQTVRPARLFSVREPEVRPLSWLPKLEVVAPPAPAPPEPEPEAPAAPPVPEPVAAPPPPPPTFLERPEQQQKLQAALASLSRAANEYADQLTHDAVELGLLIARKLVEIEISTNPEALRALVDSAIRRAGEEAVTRVRLHPDDVERVRAASSPSYEVVADAALQPGDVMVDTAHHAIDGRLATRFEELVRQLEASLG